MVGCISTFGHGGRVDAFRAAVLVDRAGGLSCQLADDSLTASAFTPHVVTIPLPLTLSGEGPKVRARGGSS